MPKRQVASAQALRFSDAWGREPIQLRKLKLRAFGGKLVLPDEFEKPLAISCGFLGKHKVL